VQEIRGDDVVREALETVPAPVTDESAA